MDRAVLNLTSRILALIFLGGLNGCKTSPVVLATAVSNPAGRNPGSPDKTAACWAGLVDAWGDWSNALRKVRNGHPLEQFEAVKGSEKERWFDAALAHSQATAATIVILQARLESLPIQGVNPQLTDHVLEWQALLPLWWEEHECEQAFLREFKAAYPKTTTLGSITFGTSRFLGALGEFFWDKVNAPTAKSNAFEDVKARVAREFAPMEQSRERAKAASDKFQAKLDQLLANNRDLRIRLSRAVGVDLPVLPTFVTPNPK